MGDKGRSGCRILRVKGARFEFGAPGVIAPEGIACLCGPQSGAQAGSPSATAGRFLGAPQPRDFACVRNSESRSMASAMATRPNVA